MGPRDLRRAVQDDIQEVLGDPAARGDRLAESIAALGARHSLEAFRAVLDHHRPDDLESIGAIVELQRLDHNEAVDRRPTNRPWCSMVGGRWSGP